MTVKKLSTAELENILDELDDFDDVVYDYDFPDQNLLLTKEKVFELLEESTIISSINHADIIMTNIFHPRYCNGKLVVGLNGEGILVYDEIIIKKYFKIEEALTRQEMNQILADSEVLFETEEGPLRIMHPTYGPAVLVPAGELYPEVKDDNWFIFHDEALDRPYPKYILSSIW
jgi:hypothetical protein